MQVYRLPSFTGFSYPRKSIKHLFFLLVVLISISCKAQELFSVTEPASNMAAGSIGFRLDNSLMNEIKSSRINYHLIPEILVGVSKKVMLQGNLFFSNRNEKFVREGGSLYVKYRFLSRDAVQKHFRMAVFARTSLNNSDIHQEEINMYGHNTGVEAGIVATQLLRKVAVSSSLSFLKALDNGNNNKFVYGSDRSKAINYTVSIGKLMLPKEYRSYKQTNFNLMIEFLSQFNPGSSKYFIDIAPSIQMIINSQSRVDIGYKKELASTLIRTAPNGIFIRLEHNIFNAFK